MKKKEIPKPNTKRVRSLPNFLVPLWRVAPPARLAEGCFQGVGVVTGSLISNARGGASLLLKRNHS